MMWSVWNDGELRRDELRATARDEAPHRSRKDRRRWCRGKVGVKHVTALRISAWATQRLRHFPDSPTTCRWVGQYHWRATAVHGPRVWEQVGWRWQCLHEEHCTRCGKILRSLLGVECPDYTERRQ